MKRYFAFVLVLFFSAGLLAPAGASEIRDDAGFFSTETVKKAENITHNLKIKYKKDVRVETFASVPENKKSEYTEETKNKFFADWARDRAHAEQLNGIYILICRNPSHLQIGVGNQTIRENLFSNDDRDNVKQILIDNFKRKQYDEGLLSALAAISSTFSEKSHSMAVSNNSESSGPVDTFPGATPPIATTTPASGTQWSWVTWLIIIGGGWLLLRFVLGVLRSASGGGGSNSPGYGPQNPGYGPQQGPGYGGGGGFLSSMLGGAVGGVAGNWLSNRVNGNTNQSAPTQQRQEQPPDRGFESTGGDFGDSGPAESGGGGDFGGGSGGDSGGGGGGGDF